jgi:four helix bundle protein
MKIQSYRDLKVWQQSMDFVVACYKVTTGFPSCEIYCLTSQLRRAAISVPANIAEGRGRRRTKEFLRHLEIAYGSLMELETHIEISKRLGQNPYSQLLEQAATIGRMTNGLRTSLLTKLLPRSGP